MARAFFLPLFVVCLLFGSSGCDTLTERNQVRQAVGHRYGVGSGQFRRALEAAAGAPFVPGNRVETLLNGDRIFPPMLAAIRRARRTVNLEMYIYQQGALASAFSRALAERARAGVKVRVILDWIGSNLGRDERRQLADAGVELFFYHAPGWYDPRRLNNRTHRKLLIVDGTEAFVGGADLADPWLGDAQSPAHWRDTHYRVTGPVVAQLQAAFLQNWTFARGELLHDDADFPSLRAAGGETAQAFASSPGRGVPTARAVYLLAIAAAERRVLIENPYFIPDPLIGRELVEARRRGVRVEILVPSERRIDSPVVHRAGRSRWGPLLAAGVEFYQYRGTMLHCKLLVVDGQWSSVGSSNVDGRSFRFNDEANMNVFGREFAARQTAVFEMDKQRARHIRLEDWKRRPWVEKLTTPIRDTFAEEL